jgi:glycosyltransferase involved in cell wall biosynthesis
MRVCLVYQGEFPSGATERIVKVARSLNAAGHEVFLLCNNYGSFELSEEPDREIHTLRLRPTFRSRALNRAVKFPVFLNPLWIAQLFLAARRFRIDALQVIDLPLAAAVLAVGRALGKPVLMDMWENYPEALRGWLEQGWKNRVLKNPTVARAVERWVTPRMDHIFTVVEEMRERLIGDGVRPERISVVTNAVDVALLGDDPIRCDTPLDQEPEAYKLLYVGVLTIERGLGDIIRALRRLEGRIPKLRLYVAGTGKYEQALRREVESQAVSHMVRFLGWAPFHEIRSYVLKSDLCLVPHVNNDFINTTLPNKLFQYMAMGKPVLVSNAKPLARIVGECSCGFVFRSGDPADAAERIEEAYHLRGDPQIGLRGRRAALERYTWDRASSGLIEAYEHLARRGRTGAKPETRRAIAGQGGDPK